MARSHRRLPLRRQQQDWGASGQLNEAAVSAIRIRFFIAFVTLGLLLLLARLWFLQIYRGEMFRDQANSNRLRPVREVAPRGVIKDSSGKDLVTNGAQFTVFLLPTDLPKDLPTRQQTLDRLSVILDLANVANKQLASSFSKIEAPLLKTVRIAATDPIPVAEGISEHTLARIAENRLYLPGVITSVEPIRQYPGGTFAAHLLGTIGQIDSKELGKGENIKYRRGDFIGKTGVERQYDNLLNGTSGGMLYEVDARGRRQKEVKENPVVAGATLTLSLEREVQQACESALNGHKGAAVAIDPRDGRVLAMASYPAYDPSIFAHRPISQTVFDGLQAQHALYNRALLSGNPPGSTFKLVTSAAGLGTGKIGLYTTEYCAGGIRLGKTFKKCDGVHGEVDLTKAIEASCDTFFYRRGLAIEPTPLADWAGNFGLGQKTGIDLPSEITGTVPSPAWKKKHFRSPMDRIWFPGDTANMAIGQGYVLATPMQIALVAAAIGNGGTIYAPRVLLKATSSDEKTVLYNMQPKVMHHIPLTPDQIARIAVGMRQVVIGSRGTSHAANLLGVPVAGKSGSAEVRGGNDAWFTCFAPYENPTIAVCVFLEADGKRLHGGVDAAPIARHMVAAHFHVKDMLAAGGGGHVTD